MRFSVDAHALGNHLTGNEVYIRNLLRSFAVLDDSSEFIAYVSAPDACHWVPERFHVRRVSGNPFLRLGADLTRRLRKDRPELIHVQYTAPLACPVPVVVSVHDVSFLERPEFFPALRAWQLRCTVRRTVKRAARILAPSEFSRRAIARAYQLDEEKITVMPNAVSSAFRPVARAAASSRVRKMLGFDAPFVFSVGDLQPRKNQIGLIRAFAELLRASPQLPHRLVLTGKDTWFGRTIREAAANSGVGDRIHFTGFVTDGDLLQLYAASEIFVFPSFYEGFGLPILEAMACGRAVACSNATAMPEVADSAALLFNPESTSEMMCAMRDLIVDSELRGRMERLGTQRAALFSWEKTAQRTLDVYYEVAARRRPAEAPVTSVTVSRS